jgi:hypothetical protein
MAYKEVLRTGADAATRHFQGFAADTEPSKNTHGKIPEGSTIWVLDSKIGKTYHEDTDTFYAIA